MEIRKIKTHPTESDLADLLGGSLPKERKLQIEGHIAGCGECLAAVVSAYESAGASGKKAGLQKKAGKFMKKLNIYLALAVLSFVLSFFTHRYFIQLLVATLLLGIKWIADSKSTKMLVMIYEAWKHGGEKEASKVLERMEQRTGIRL